MQFAHAEDAFPSFLGYATVYQSRSSKRNNWKELELSKYF